MKSTMIRIRKRPPPAAMPARAGRDRPAKNDTTLVIISLPPGASVSGERPDP